MFCLFSFTEVKREEYTGADPGFQVRGGALKKIGANIFGYFVWKITILRQKINFFPILGCARAEYAPPPLDPPLVYMVFHWYLGVIVYTDYIVVMIVW
jgi:hypothetical protein